MKLELISELKMTKMKLTGKKAKETVDILNAKPVQTMSGVNGGKKQKIRREKQKKTTEIKTRNRAPEVRGHNREDEKGC